jgi:ubiquinone/menaquinone biosynthesis C-methylase UbiE
MSIDRLYENSAGWEGAKTMQHASGVWGRNPMLKYLEDEVVREGDIVIDLGSGAGYPTVKIAEMARQKMQVIGIELSPAMLGLNEGQTPIAKMYESVKNVNFVHGDVRALPFENEKANVATSFMVLHNLTITDVEKTFAETARILKPDGKAVFLTMHPDALVEDWDLDFMQYDDAQLKALREAPDNEKEDMLIKGVVRNSGGGEKNVAMHFHSRDSILQAAEKAGLTLTAEKALHIDEETAIENFGKDAVRKVPKQPIFWIITLKKK